MNHFIKNSPTSWEPTKATPKGLSKVEGIITSTIQLKELREGKPYY